MSIMSISKIMVSKRNDQSIRHERILHTIRLVMKGTPDEFLIEQYTFVISYARFRFIHDYNQILDDLEFILNYNRPIEKVLTMLETYMIVLDVLYDIDCMKRGIKFDLV